MPKRVPSGEHEALGRRADDRVGSGSTGPRARSIRGEHLRARDDARRVPAGRAADVHVLDEAHLERSRRARSRAASRELVVVDAAQDDRVDLRAREARRRGPPRCPREHPRVLVAARQGARSARGAACRGSPSAARARRASAPSPAAASRIPLVVSARSRSPGFAASESDEHRAGRAAAGGSPPVRRIFSTPSARKTSTSARQLLEREDVGARQPARTLLRHAVGAAQVAAVRDREPQVAERPAEAIEGRHRTHDDATDRSLRALRPGRSLIEGGQLLDARERAVFTEQPEHRRPHEVCVAVERRVPACGPVE